MDNKQIINRIKKLLNLAEDKANMEESHSAFLMAQKLMVKYGVNPSEITEDEEVREVLRASGTQYKRLYWWERELSHIVAKNFRCKNYINSKREFGKVQVQRKIMFMGTKEDIELANAMYKLVINAILFYSNRYSKNHYVSGVRGYTVQLKNDYMNGFIAGLEEKFEEQISNQEWGLVLVVPKEVEEEYKNTIFGNLSYTIPKTRAAEHYLQGYKDGKAIDYKKETVGNGT